MTAHEGAQEGAHIKSMSIFETNEHLQGSAFCLARGSVKWSAFALAWPCIYR
jgi:hypothetical protein